MEKETNFFVLVSNVSSSEYDLLESLIEEMFNARTHWVVWGSMLEGIQELKERQSECALPKAVNLVIIFVPLVVCGEAEIQPYQDLIRTISPDTKYLYLVGDLAATIALFKNEERFDTDLPDAATIKDFIKKISKMTKIQPKLIGL